MSIKPSIIRRIKELGGIPPEHADSLRDFLLGTSFSHYLYDEDWEGYGVDEFVEKHRDLFDQDRGQFIDRIEAYFFSEHDDGCGQSFWQPDMFTPFTPNTEDFEEWDSWFSEYADLSPVQSVCDPHDGPLEFVQIMTSYGYPDHYYICLQDRSQDNPTVFGTDHEQFFQELTPSGSLSQFLDSYYTREEPRRAIVSQLPE